jgi:hypothetical protein
VPFSAPVAVVLTRLLLSSVDTVVKPTLTIRSPFSIANAGIAVAKKTAPTKPLVTKPEKDFILTPCKNHQ